MTCLSPLVALERIGKTKTVFDKVSDRSKGIPTDPKKYLASQGVPKPNNSWIFLDPSRALEDQFGISHTPRLNKHEAEYLNHQQQSASLNPVEFNSDGKHRYIHPTLRPGVKCSIKYKGEKLRVQVKHVPCGQCDPCRIAIRDAWQTRMKLEYLSAQALGLRAFFITLTYNESSIKHKGGYRRGLHYPEFQRFLARLYKYALRKQAPRMPVPGFYSDGGTGTTSQVDYPLMRYFVVGEYGDQKHRAHFHMILFGVDFHDKQFKFDPSSNTEYETSATLDALWGYGFCHIGTVTPESIGYCAAYIAKEHRFSPESFRYPHFVRQIRIKDDPNPPMPYAQYQGDCEAAQTDPLSNDDFLKLGLGLNEFTLKDRQNFLYLPYHQLLREGYTHDDIRLFADAYKRAPFSADGQHFKSMCELRRSEFCRASTQPPLGFYWLAMQNVDRLIKVGKISLVEEDKRSSRPFVEKPLSRSILNMLISPRMVKAQNLSVDQWFERAKKIDKLKADIVQDVEDEYQEMNRNGTTPRLEAVRSQKVREHNRTAKQRERKAAATHAPRPTLD